MSASFSLCRNLFWTRYSMADRRFEEICCSCSAKCLSLQANPWIGSYRRNFLPKYSVIWQKCMQHQTKISSLWSMLSGMRARWMNGGKFHLIEMPRLFLKFIVILSHSSPCECVIQFRTNGWYWPLVMNFTLRMLISQWKQSINWDFVLAHGSLQYTIEIHAACHMSTSLNRILIKMTTTYGKLIWIYLQSKTTHEGKWPKLSFRFGCARIFQNSELNS